MSSEPSKKRRRKSTVPINHDAAIGRVARSWGHLEYMLDLAIWDLGNFEHQFGACVTAQAPNYNQKLNAIIALVKLRRGSDALQTKLNKFMAALHGVADLRNRAVHDPRLNKGKQVFRMQVTTKGKMPVFGPVPEDIDQLHDLSESIRDQIFRWRELRDTINSELLSSPPTPPLQLQRIVDLSGPRTRSSAKSKPQRPQKAS